MTERPDAPPEGKLISAALAARRSSGLTQRKAAPLAGISEGRWRQIATGYVSVNGEKARVRGTDYRVARMAHVVGVTPEELENADRPEAAEQLRRLEAKAAAEAERRDARGDAGSGPESPDGSQTRVEDRWRILRAVLRETGVGLSRSEQGDLRGRIDVFFAEDQEWPSADDLPNAEEQRPGAADL